MVFISLTLKASCSQWNRLLENGIKNGVRLLKEFVYGWLAVVLPTHCVRQHVLKVIEIAGPNVKYAVKNRKAFMFAGLNITAESHTAELSHRLGRRRVSMVVASMTAVLILSACGGGGDAGPSPINFNIGVTVGGQFVNQTTVAPGGSLGLAVRVGQSLILDAGEPAVWTVLVGGNAITGGAQVFFAGANITATTLNPSAVVVDTGAAFPLRDSIPITLVATSTFDSVQVATVNLLITN